MINFQKKLFIYWLITSIIALTLSFVFNAFIGIAFSVGTLVLMLFIVRWKNNKDGGSSSISFGFFGSNNLASNGIRYLCLKCSNLNKSATCPKCGGKMSKAVM